MVHDEHKPFGDDYDYKQDPEGLVYWKKGRTAPGTAKIVVHVCNTNRLLVLASLQHRVLFIHLGFHII